MPSGVYPRKPRANGRPRTVRTAWLLQVLRRRIERVRIIEAKYGDGGESSVLGSCAALLKEWLDTEQGA